MTSELTLGVRQSDGSFVMYYSASTKADTAKHCVGAAKASSVTGPYTPIGSSALICPLSKGGAIDASGYNDNGKRYIIYKVDGNSIGHGGACGNDSELARTSLDDYGKLRERLTLA